MSERGDKIRLLADWIDSKYPHDNNPEIQRDLRRWAVEADAAPALLEALESVVYSYDDDSRTSLQVRMEAIIDQARAAIRAAKGNSK